MEDVQTCVNRAVAIWAERSWRETWNRVVDNITGKMLNTVSATLRKHVETGSVFTPTSFSFAVGLSYGVAWHGQVSGSYPNWTITPTPRKAFFVRPVHRRALSWVSGGRRYFSKGHMIPPWQFRPPRPFIAQPMMEMEQSYTDILRRSLTEELQQAFPDQKVEVVL